MNGGTNLFGGCCCGAAFAGGGCLALYDPTHDGEAVMDGAPGQSASSGWGAGDVRLAAALEGGGGALPLRRRRLAAISRISRPSEVRFMTACWAMPMRLPTDQ